MIRRFENGDIRASGAQFAVRDRAVGQGIKHRLRLFLGEFFLDVGDGTPWFQSILGKAPQGVAEVAVKQRILSAPGVDFIRRFSFTSDREARRITLDVTVRTTEGYDADLTLDEGLF